MTDLRIIKAFAKGLLTFIPGVAQLLTRKKRTSKHSGSIAEFCYTLWLSLLVHFEENGVSPDFETVGELGSGGSVGVGICALLTGTKQYFTLDIEDHYDKENNLKLLSEIVSLLRNKTRIPSSYKQINIKISKYDYPSHLISPRFMDNAFIDELRNEINDYCLGTKHLIILYDWYKKPALKLDMVFSRAVMEHVNDPYSVYKNLSFHLKSGAFSFHDIEFHSHGITKNINGHLDINKAFWAIIYGRRPYFLNRWTLKDHINALEDLNYYLIYIDQNIATENDPLNENLVGATILSKYG